MNRIMLFEQFIAEMSSEVLSPKRGKWIKISPAKHPELAEEFFELITTAYAEIGGHSKIKSPQDVFADPDWIFWKGIDIHGTPDLDLIVFGKDTKYGIKYAGVGHDGKKESKKFYLDFQGKELKQKGFYAEVSGKLASIFMDKYGVPYLNNKEDVEKVLGMNVIWKGKNTEDENMPGDGWYERKIGGEFHQKILLGKPKI